MKTFKFTIVETNESKKLDFTYLDFDIIFQNSSKHGRD